MVEWFIRALELKSGGPWFNSSTLPLSRFILCGPGREQLLGRVVLVTNWSAFHQLGFLIICVLFAIFVYLQCHQLAQQCKIHLTLIKLYSFHILNNVNLHVFAVKKNSRPLSVITFSRFR